MLSDVKRRYTVNICTKCKRQRTSISDLYLHNIIIMRLVRDYTNDFDIVVYEVKASLQLSHPLRR